MSSTITGTPETITSRSLDSWASMAASIRGRRISGSVLSVSKMMLVAAGLGVNKIRLKRGLPSGLFVAILKPPAIPST